MLFIILYVLIGAACWNHLIMPYGLLDNFRLELAWIKSEQTLKGKIELVIDLGMAVILWPMFAVSALFEWIYEQKEEK